MYGWVWRHLPGNVAVRLLLALVLSAFVVYLLFEHVFPWLDPQLPWNQVTVESNGQQVGPR